MRGENRRNSQHVIRRAIKELKNILLSMQIEYEDTKWLITLQPNPLQLPAVPIHNVCWILQGEFQPQGPLWVSPCGSVGQLGPKPLLSWVPIDLGRWIRPRKEVRVQWTLLSWNQPPSMTRSALLTAPDKTSSFPPSLHFAHSLPPSLHNLIWGCALSIHCCVDQTSSTGQVELTNIVAFATARKHTM